VPNWSKWLLQEARSGGAVVDLLVHDIDQALSLFGIPEYVAGKSIGEGPDTLMGTLMYPSGPEVRIQGGWFAPGSPLRMSFRLRADWAELELTPDGLTLSDTTGQRSRVEVANDDAYEAEIEYFIECCRTGNQPERCMPTESAQALKIALLLKQSRAAGGDQLKCSV
jgi:predicted dehydrogenase